MTLRTHSCALAALSLAGAMLAACGDDTTGSGGSAATSTGAGASTAGGSIDVIMNGEDLATDGIAFPLSGEVAIADGWEIQFDHVLVTVDRITLSENPDKNPSDQSQVDVEHPTGHLLVDVIVDGDTDPPRVVRSGVVRTARKLFDGIAFPRA